MADLSRQAAENVKACCAALYATDGARFLLGDTFHPGGLRLTERLGEMLGLQPGDRVLDVAAGSGASALFLARRFGCEVVGVDFGAELVEEAALAASRAGLADHVRFERGDAERLPVVSASFDAVICECALCTFPDKRSAAAELARALRIGGKVGVADLTLSDALPAELKTLAAWIACIGDARPLGEYLGYLRDAGFTDPVAESHDEALRQLVRGVRTKLQAAERLASFARAPLPRDRIGEARKLAEAAGAAIDDGRLGYALVVATRA